MREFLLDLTPFGFQSCRHRQSSKHSEAFDSSIAPVQTTKKIYRLAFLMVSLSNHSILARV